jgi:hypothetical protein
VFERVGEGGYRGGGGAGGDSGGWSGLLDLSAVSHAINLSLTHSQAHSTDSS